MTVQGLFDAVQLRLDRVDVGELVVHVLLDRAVVAQLAELREVADLHPLGPLDAAFGGFDAAQQASQERRLARPVIADQPHAVTFGQAKEYLPQDELLLKPYADVLYANQAHPFSVAGGYHFQVRARQPTGPRLWCTLPRLPPVVQAGRPHHKKGRRRQPYAPGSFSFGAGSSGGLTKRKNPAPFLHRYTPMAP